MENENLTREDISTLIEAMDAWVSRHASGEIVGSIFEAMLEGKGGNPAMKAKREQERSAKRIEHELEKDTAALLKAKLIRLRQRQTVHA